MKGNQGNVGSAKAPFAHFEHKALAIPSTMAVVV